MVATPGRVVDMTINDKAQRTADILRARRQMGVASRSRRIPRPLLPRAIEREYARALMEIVDRVDKALEPLRAMLPGLLASAAETRMDAGETRTAQRAIESIRERMQDSMSTEEIERLAERFGRRTTDFQKAQLARQVTAALGIDVFMSDRWLAGLLDGFVVENVALIKSLPDQVIGNVERTVTRAVQSGTTNRDLAKQINGMVEGGRKRAKVIARDQINKIYGQANEARQREIGVTEYVWRTVKDQRVRDQHANREGERFKWREPPEDGHPAQPVQCRCFAEPSFDAILGEAK